MCQIRSEKFEPVNNSQYKFHKLYIDGVCQIDEFIEEINTNGSKQERNAIIRIIAYMSIFSDQVMLPKTKFRQIQSSVRKDIFEFKYDSIRVYVLKQKPDIYVVLGGYKKSQTKDIKRLEKDIKNFKPTEP